MQVCLSRGCRGCPAAVQGERNQRWPWPSQGSPVRRGQRRGESWLREEGRPEGGAGSTVPASVLASCSLGGSSCGVQGVQGTEPSPQSTSRHCPCCVLPAGGQWDHDSCPLQPEGAREARGGHSRHMCASHMHFKRWRYPGIQQPGSSKHPVDKG